MLILEGKCLVLKVVWILNDKIIVCICINYTAEEKMKKRFSLLENLFCNIFLDLPLSKKIMIFWTQYKPNIANIGVQ